MPTTSFGVVRRLYEGMMAGGSDVFRAPFETAMMRRLVSSIEAFEVGCAMALRC